MVSSHTAIKGSISEQIDYHKGTITIPLTHLEKKKEESKSTEHILLHNNPNKLESGPFDKVVAFQYRNTLNQVTYL